MTRQAHGNETREFILATAERLFAEHGISTVSNRQICEAAKQGNNFAVGYHFGTKADLVRAIVRQHVPAIERRRAAFVQKSRSSTELRDWLTCLVLPHTEHLASLGSPSWYARFIAQTITVPTLRDIVRDETIASAAMIAVIEGLTRLMPVLPEQVHKERAEMSRHLIVHTCAERERALHEGHATPRASWAAFASGLIDALVGLWQAPVTSTS